MNGNIFVLDHTEMGEEALIMPKDINPDAIGLLDLGIPDLELAFRDIFQVCQEKNSWKFRKEGIGSVAVKFFNNMLREVIIVQGSQEGTYYVHPDIIDLLDVKTQRLLEKQ